MLKKDFVRFKPKHKPQKNEIEMVMAGMLDSLSQSMDAAHLERDQLDLTTAEQFNASYIITRVEIGHIKAFLDNCNKASLRQKHKALYKRIDLFHDFLDPYPQVITDDEVALTAFTKAWVQFMNDSHLILSEKTPKRERNKILEEAGGIV
tara:strand:+ start:1907 stop:2356 length:450 start_codon:yes stop_codon:yes gene_type:complete